MEVVFPVLVELHAPMFLGACRYAARARAWIAGEPRSVYGLAADRTRLGVRHVYLSLTYTIEKAPATHCAPRLVQCRGSHRIAAERR